ncbi:MAG: ClpXP protease specificity-enhancing factor [Burkholderiales bacterium 66-5]|jgi:stringent starvation protein B|uniref:ClpXP protease specificity-enhancing factor n=1 Tax=Comamonas badia TaxID=265291 RepID=UPI00041584E1|nr:ClpXP protease specificity-enhancing factor [Comamonas badia]OJU89557.1 MAG: ClpXP protease specificity-enhancing factor [Burkholderiales bacterium 66-5]
MDGDAKDVSTRPYLLRALHEWCSDSGLTPYIVVRVDDSVQVPREYVTDGEIVLNVSDEATSALQISNEFVVFKARFGGKPRDIAVPIGRVSAIYARENGQGMAFPVEEGPALLQQTPDALPQPAGLQSVKDTKAPTKPQGDPPKPSDPHGRRPALKRIK